DFRGEGSLCPGKVINEVSKCRKCLCAGTAIGEGESTASIDRYELLCSLDHHVQTDSERVISHRVRDRVLELVVVEDTALRKGRIRPETGYSRSTAAKYDLRRRREQFRVAIVEEHVEPAITKACFVSCFC